MADSSSSASDPVTIDDIDEALNYAIQTRRITDDFRKPIVDHFINELLDARLKAKRR